MKRVSAPDPRTIELAASAAEILKAHQAAKHPAPPRLRVEVAGSEAAVALPDAAFALLIAGLEELAQGHSVALAPVAEELTTQQAADLLNVSRPYLIGLLEADAIPFRRVGNRRKIRLQDVLEFQNRDRQRREDLLDQMASESQALGLYE